MKGMNNSMEKRLLLKPAAKVLGLSENYLRTEARACRIPFIKVGNRYLFDINQVEEFLKNKALESMKLGGN